MEMLLNLHSLLIKRQALLNSLFSKEKILTTAISMK